jgi:PcfJ-like protein
MKAIRFDPIHKDPLFLFLKQYPGLRPCNMEGSPVSPLCAWMIEKTGVFTLGMPLTRTPETWVIPKNMDYPTLLRSFIDHVLVRYPMPEFFYQVWNSGTKLHKQWFAHLGSGKNFRTASKVPEGLYGKLTHYFLLAPHWMTLAQALTYGRVKGMDGSDKLAKAFARSPLGDYLDMDFRYESLISLYIQDSGLTIPMIKPTLAFFMKKYILEGAVDFPRDASLFLERMKEAQQQEAYEKACSAFDKTAFKAHITHHQITEVVVEKHVFQFSQIRTPLELRQEGKLMQHCVGGYVNQCKRGSCSIWSVTLRNECYNVNKRLTIEVLRNRVISQVRGRYNRAATELETKAVYAWANMYKLKKR